MTIYLYKPAKLVHADINDTGGNGPGDQLTGGGLNQPAQEDFEFVANPDADAMERDLQKKIILYQNRRSQADIEKAKKIRSMLEAYRFDNGIVIDEPKLVTSPAAKSYSTSQSELTNRRRPTETERLANENELRALASKRARLAKFLERVRQGGGGGQYRPTTSMVRATAAAPVATRATIPATKWSRAPPTSRPTTTRPSVSFDTSAKYVKKLSITN